MKKTMIFTLLVSAAMSASAQQFVIQGTSDERTAPMKPEMTEYYYPKVPAVTPGDINTRTAPSDAIVLFDGTSLDAWTNSEGGKAGWKVNGDGTMTVDKSTGDIKTKESFGDCQIHLEWCVAEGETGSGQARGNSGIYIQGRYEVQILDSYLNETYSNGQAGSIYKQSAPLVNPTRPNGQWNVYDIIFKAPIFKEDGTFRKYPEVTVLFNGVLVQDCTTIVGTTEYIGLPTVGKHGDEPFTLQAHCDPSEPISFRNIWIRKL